MFDLAFVLRDCHGDIEAAQRRVDRALREARAEGMREVVKALEYERDKRTNPPDIHLINMCIGVVSRVFSGEDVDAKKD